MEIKGKLQQFIYDRNTPAGVTLISFAMALCFPPKNIDNTTFAVIIILNLLLIVITIYSESVRKQIIPRSEEIEEMLIEGKERMQKVCIAMISCFIVLFAIFYFRPNSTLINSMLLAYIVFTYSLVFSFAFYVRKIQNCKGREL